MIFSRRERENEPLPMMTPHLALGTVNVTSWDACCCCLLSSQPPPPPPPYSWLPPLRLFERPSKRSRPPLPPGPPDPPPRPFPPLPSVSLLWTLSINSSILCRAYKHAQHSFTHVKDVKETVPVPLAAVFRTSNISSRRDLPPWPAETGPWHQFLVVSS